MADQPPRFDRRTARVYDEQAADWIATSWARHDDELAWVNASRRLGPVVDLGSGPGWHLIPLDEPRIGLDIAPAMVAATRSTATSPVVVASAAGLPFARQSLGGAVASRVHTHLPLDAFPRALAELHRALQPDAPVLFQFVTTEDAAAGWGDEVRGTKRLAGRLFSRPTSQGLNDLLLGGGFMAADDAPLATGADGPEAPTVCCRPAFSLPDTVGPGMRLLICGLNPSPSSAELGVGFGRPGNRFWPAALTAGLVSVDRDPLHALDRHGIGMTDLVKRTTRKASEISTDEFTAGLERVERLVAWLQPRAVCFVGLAGWRAAIDRKAKAGVQPELFGRRPVYLMPSTSGLNASSQLPDLTEHLSAAAALADSAHLSP